MNASSPILAPIPDSHISSVASIQELRDRIKDLQLKETELFALVDKNVLNMYPSLFEGFQDGHIIAVPSGEPSKSMQSAEQVLAWMMKAKASRQCFILGIGGGVTTDLTGFVASLFKRGVRFGLIPTTLLGMVDASIGGKNGINIYLKDYDGSSKPLRMKNMAGTFYQPEFVIECPEFLNTLPIDELRSGETELLKTLLIFDGDAYRNAVSVLKSFSVNDYLSGGDRSGFDSAIEPLIIDSATLKERICAEDPHDHGIRRLLNLGHTYGHAIEEVYPDHCTHGSAVALGIELAMHFGVATGITPPDVCDSISADLDALKLPASKSLLSSNALDSAIAFDKKARQNNITFIFVQGIGDVVSHEVALKLLLCKNIQLWIDNDPRAL
jgi:3-dehydroquinate synthase